MKLGEDLPIGAVFKRRNFSGEVIPKNARGRDPIVTRIIWLDGIEPETRTLELAASTFTVPRRSAYRNSQQFRVCANAIL